MLPPHPPLATAEHLDAGPSSGARQALRAATADDHERVDRTFASTDGSRMAQTFSYAFPEAEVRATVAGPEGMAFTGPKGFDWAAAGYEVVRDARLEETMRAAAEEALMVSSTLSQG